MRGKNEDSPAKKRYDRKKPVVSFRISTEQLEKLNYLIKGSGMSKGRFLRGALDLGLDKKDLIHRKGYREGYEEAKQKYTAFVQCKGCGEPIPVIGIDMNLLIAHAVEELYNWYHKDCRPPVDPNIDFKLFDRKVDDE